MIKKLEQRQIHNSKQEGELIYNKTTKQLVLFNNGEFNKVLLDGDAPTVDLSSKQDVLVSGTNIKTINGNSLLGSGNITISGGGIAQNYSTSEQALLNPDGSPLLWIDGKQVYRQINNYAGMTFQNLEIINTLDTLISQQGYLVLQGIGLMNLLLNFGYAQFNRAFEIKNTLRVSMPSSFLMIEGFSMITYTKI